MRTLIAITAFAVALAFAGSAMAQSRATVTTHGSTYGTILFDGRGFALYAFTKDSRGRSACAGACAKAWPPYTVARAAQARGAKVGTIRRADGRLQVTYAGRPLYYYVGDRKAGQILCQNVREFGGLWLVVRPDGTLVR
jgi:predicted lipoprotein with Yx(FWY)xxD motif